MEDNQENDKNSVGSGIDRVQNYDLLKEVQNEIKDKVISKYLLTIEHQAKELAQLKKENTILKNQLTYILKRILLNKYDYNSAARTNRLNNLNSTINYNRSMLINDNNLKSNTMLRPLRSCENYRTVTDKITSKYKENNNSPVNIQSLDTNTNPNNNDSLNMKISGYLNSLYMHNFGNTNGGNLSLNKNQTLYDELFPNKNSSYYLNIEDPIIEENLNKNQTLYDELFPNKNSSYYLNIEEPIIEERIKYKSAKKRENNSVNSRYLNKKNITGYKSRRKNYSTGKRYKSKYLDTSINNSSAKKRNKENSYLDHYEKGKYNTVNNTRTQKNKIKKPIIYMKRSPFIANKF